MTALKARVIRPSFFKDKRVQKWPAELRMFYIGVWCLSDDAGFLRYDIEDIAAELYPYRVPSSRERMVQAMWGSLVEEGRVRVLDCGRHAVVPTVEVYRFKGGNHSFTVRSEHARRCSSNGEEPGRSSSSRVRVRVGVPEDLESQEENELELSNSARVPFSELVPRPVSKR